MTEAKPNLQPTLPYFLQAYRKWILDNGFTPLLEIDATVPDTMVPAEYVRDGKITLNYAPTAIANLSVTSHFVTFSASFDVGNFEVVLPLPSIQKVYPDEAPEMTLFFNGEMFNDGSSEVEEVDISIDPTSLESEEGGSSGSEGKKRGKGSHLRVVK